MVQGDGFAFERNAGGWWSMGRVVSHYVSKGRRTSICGVTSWVWRKPIDRRCGKCVKILEKVQAA
jgi:hypothetical protein